METSLILSAISGAIESIGNSILNIVGVVQNSDTNRKVLETDAQKYGNSTAYASNQLYTQAQTFKTVIISFTVIVVAFFVVKIFKK